MRQPLVAGNWKMNGSSAFAKELIAGLVDAWRPDGPDLAVFPPAFYLGVVRDAIGATGIAAGAQKVIEHPRQLESLLLEDGAAAEVDALEIIVVPKHASGN